MDDLDDHVRVLPPGMDDALALKRPTAQMRNKTTPISRSPIAALGTSFKRLQAG